MELVCRTYQIIGVNMRNKASSMVSNHGMRSATIFAVLVAGDTWLQAAEFKGAAEVLRQAAQAPSKPREQRKDPYEPFREKLKVFQAQSTSLPAAQQATQWLALVDDFEKQSGEVPVPM